MSGGPVCDPVWQYVLIMVEEMHGLMDGLEKIGIYQTSEKLEPVAEDLDKMIHKLRKGIEGLTGWEPEGDHEYPPH